MAIIIVTKRYTDGSILLEADLDAIKSSIETFINTTKINDDNIQTGGITGSTKLVAASVTAAKMAADSVDTTQLVAASVTTAKIADSAVTTAKLNDGSVTGVKLDSGIVDDSTLEISSNVLQIKDGGVTQDKIADTALSVSSSSAGFTTNSASYVDVTNLSVSITGFGRPVLLCLRPDESSGLAQAAVYSGGVAASADFRIVDSTESLVVAAVSVGDSTSSAGNSNRVPVGNIWGIYDGLGSPSSGFSRTFKVQCKTNGTAVCSYVKLVAVRL